MEVLKYISIYIIFTLLIVTTTRVRCDKETTESEPTDEDYSLEGDEDADASNENYTEKQTDRELHARSNEQRSAASSTSTPTTTTTTTPTTTTTEPTDIHPKESVCPDKCRCIDDNKLVNCSTQQLHDIPEKLPVNVEIIDLSNNQLTGLNVGALKEYTALRELLLANNQIESIIDKGAFAYLEELEIIDLAANKLNALHGDEFDHTRILNKLVLSHNLNIISKNRPLVKVAELDTLQLVGCNITELSDNTFEHLSSLYDLNLKDNPLEQYINVNAFRQFSNLRTLQVNDVPRNEIRELCDTLTAIDVINMEKYDVSCFQITMGMSFENSTVKAGTATESPIEDTFDEFLKPMQVTENAVITSTASIANTKLNDSDSHEPITVPKAVNAGQQVNAMSQNATSQVNNGTEGVAVAKDDTSKVHISQQSINTILIAIIIVALIGLLIGVICRIDCCGIKTKMCRTRRRPAPTDQIRPAEEVPLNKV